MYPLISVIIPIFKVEEYICECVESVINQTYKNLEIILVDDGSPDNCGRICDEYALKDERIKVIHKENGGLSDARNVGLVTAKGEYIVFVDGDDCMPDDGIEYLYYLISSKKADIAIGGVERFSSFDKAVISSEYKGAPEEKVWDKIDAMKDVFLNGCAAWARIYKKDIHKDVYFPKGEINEDEAIVLHLLDKCEKVAKSNKIVYHYRFRPNSITTVDFSVKKFDWYCHCKANLEFIKEKYPEITEYAEKRYNGSIIFLLTSIAMIGKQQFLNVLPELWEEFKSRYKSILNNSFSTIREKGDSAVIRIFGLNGYRITVTVLRKIKRKIFTTR